MSHVEPTAGVRIIAPIRRFDAGMLTSQRTPPGPLLLSGFGGGRVHSRVGEPRPSMCPEHERLAGGTLNAALANEIGRLFADAVGRGATRSRAFVSNDTVVCV